MDEASSKYVDRIVLSKLLDEHLSRVHHFPKHEDLSRAVSVQDALREMAGHDIRIVSRKGKRFWFASPLNSPFPENNLCEVIVHVAAQAQGNIVLQHGLFEDNREIHDFMIRQLTQAGMNVFHATLPYHYGRKPREARFSGEYFWSADFGLTLGAFRQAVQELLVLYRYVETLNDLPTVLGGFSMGGCVALLLASQVEDLTGVVAINPAASLSGIVWDSPLCSTIKADYLASGVSMEELYRIYRPFEPLGQTEVALEAERIQLLYGLYDQVTSPRQYEKLAKAWGLTEVRAYKAGHLNMLRVPRLAADVAAFVQRVGALQLQKEPG